MHLNKYDIVHVKGCPREIAAAHGEKWYIPEGRPPVNWGPVMTLCAAGCNDRPFTFKQPETRVRPFLTPIPGCVARVVNTTGERENVCKDRIAEVEMKPYELCLPNPEPNAVYLPHEHIPFMSIVVVWGRCPECDAVHWSYRRA